MSWNRLIRNFAMFLPEYKALKLPKTCPYPEPVQSTPRHPILILEYALKYYSPIYYHVFTVVSFHQVSPPYPMSHSSPPYVPHSSPISFLLIWSTEYIWWGVSADHKAPIYVVFSTPRFGEEDRWIRIGKMYPCTGTEALNRPYGSWKGEEV